jgi:hypothetical protein
MGSKLKRMGRKWAFIDSGKKKRAIDRKERAPPILVLFLYLEPRES